MRILVVDDSPVARIALRGMLEANGFTVTEASGGNEGLRTFGRAGADVVLCDLFMPGCDGIQVIGELRRDFPGVKVIAISGGGLDGTLDLLPEALRVGADDVLYKPFGPAALLKAIRQVVQKPAWTAPVKAAVR